MSLMTAAVAGLLLLICSAQAQFLPDDAQNLKTAPEVERLFVVKTAENLLTEKAQRMLNDPENAKDGFMWARKVMARHYAGLETLAGELSTGELARFYAEKAGLFVKSVRGEISDSQFEQMEIELERRKSAYFETIIATAKPTRNPDFDTLNRIAKTAASKVHSYSALSVD